MSALKYSPNTLIVDQTILCNQECFFCWRSDRAKVRDETDAAPHKIMPMELYQEIVSQGARHGLERLCLSGPMGEPTLAPDLASRGLYAKNKGFRYTLINTNGVALARHDPKLLLLGFDEVCISLDAVDEQTYRAIHGRSNQYHKVMDNIERLIAVNAERVCLRFTETEHNRGDWSLLKKRFGGRCNLVAKRAHSFIDVRKAAEGAAGCNQPHGSVNYTYTGQMSTCCVNYKRSPVFGHISEGLKECWEGEAFERWRMSRLDGLCKGCSGLGQHGIEKLRL